MGREKGTPVVTGKTARRRAKSAEKSAPGRPFEPGSDARRGKGPPKGAPNAGRPPIAFKAECESICNALLLPAIRAYLAENDPSDPGYRWAADKMLDYGQGRPVQRVEGADGKPLLVIGVA